MNKCEIINQILEALPKQPTNEDPSLAKGYWSNGSEILCSHEIDSEIIADFLDSIVGEKVSHTGYYDPYEDAASGEIDDNTGFYYVDFD